MSISTLFIPREGGESARMLEHSLLTRQEKRHWRLASSVQVERASSTLLNYQSVELIIILPGGFGNVMPMLDFGTASVENPFVRAQNRRMFPCDKIQIEHDDDSANPNSEKGDQISFMYHPETTYKLEGHILWETSWRDRASAPTMLSFSVQLKPSENILQGHNNQKQIDFRCTPKLSQYFGG